MIERFGTWEGFLGLVAIGFVAYSVAVVPEFATDFNISQAIAGMSERGLIVLPMVLLIIAREIDLSVASTLALASVVFGVAVQAGLPIGAAVAAAVATGAVAGAFNGVLVTVLGLPSLVVTLGTMAMFRGIGYVILGPRSVNVFPDSFTDFGIDNVGSAPIPWTFVPFLVLLPLFVIVLGHTALGRRIYVIGGNPEAARYSGVRVDRIRFGLFVVSGIVAAIAGIVYAARLANSRADNALGMELDIIIIALLGGVSVFGGRGKLIGVFFAMIIIAVLRNVLGLYQISGDAQGTSTGLLLIAALLLNSTVQRIYAKYRIVPKRIQSAGPRSGGQAVTSNEAPNTRM
ncbi:ABC transporter permease [Labrys wisconsinensis]|uniref:Autoinducer 2 import system permease protein LsrD n=1 Tax=Labrys wisconsinensis TaxID=425677 RepID=A0ABU0J1K9_9HYPH|nr:ABC transporter permease [Labrys wisconsinensis]MDQ0468124.1 rhamnose transport system permease protein [Labrys wisconsinensis]